MITVSLKGLASAFFVGVQSEKLWSHLFPEFKGEPTGIFKSPGKLATFGMNDYEKYDYVLPTRPLLRDLKLARQTFDIVSISTLGGGFHGTLGFVDLLERPLRLCQPSGLFVARITKEQLLDTWYVFGKRLGDIYMTRDRESFIVAGVKLKVPKRLGDRDDAHCLDEERFKKEVMEMIQGNFDFPEYNYEIEATYDGTIPKDWRSDCPDDDYISRMFTVSPASLVSEELESDVALEVIPMTPDSIEAVNFMASGMLDGQDLIRTACGAYGYLCSSVLTRTVSFPVEKDPLTGERVTAEEDQKESISRFFCVDAGESEEFTPGEWYFTKH